MNDLIGTKTYCIGKGNILFKATITNVEEYVNSNGEDSMLFTLMANHSTVNIDCNRCFEHKAAAKIEMLIELDEQFKDQENDIAYELEKESIMRLIPINEED